MYLALIYYHFIIPISATVCEDFLDIREIPNVVKLYIGKGKTGLSFFA